MDTMVSWGAVGTAGRGFAGSLVCVLMERTQQVVESSAAMDSLPLNLSGNGPLLAAAVIGALLGVTRWGALLVALAASGVAIVGEAQTNGLTASLVMLIGLLLSGIVDRALGAVLKRVVTGLGWLTAARRPQYLLIRPTTSPFVLRRGDRRRRKTRTGITR